MPYGDCGCCGGALLSDGRLEEWTEQYFWELPPTASSVVLMVSRVGKSMTVSRLLVPCKWAVQIFGQENEFLQSVSGR